MLFSVFIKLSLLLSFFLQESKSYSYVWTTLIIGIPFVPTVMVSSFTLKPYSSLSSLRRIYKRRRKVVGDKINFTNETLVINTSDFITTNDVDEDEMELHIHQKLMDKALDEAKIAGKLGEVPIGAIIVQEEMHQLNPNERKFTILSKGQNQIETIHDASAHAELQAMRAASRNIQNWRLINTTLYTTLEPCPMCLSAAQAFRVSKIVYGAPDLRLGAVETHIQLLDVVKHPFHDNMEVLGGIKKDECGKILVDFFRQRRKQSKRKKPEKANEESVSDNPAAKRSSWLLTLFSRII